MDELVAVANKLSSLGFSTLVILILYGNYKGVWVWGTQLKRAEERGDKWQTLALQLAGLAKKSTDIAASVQSAGQR